jgi:hypothetical protein
MPQQQCPWCHGLGARYTDDDYRENGFKAPSWAAPHAETPCRSCGHPNVQTVTAAKRDGGRVFINGRWDCYGCKPDAFRNS